jgi:peptidoglycan/xylan/chitin deacetylase (PgdA/CDA1 family)
MIRAFDALILTYHSISPGPPPLCLPPDVFAAQMDWLKAKAHVIPLRVLVESLAEERPLPPKTVVLTFDDGLCDFYTKAASILKGLGLPAINFLPAAYCGKTASWNIGAGGQPLMGWEQIRELAENGLSFGSHSMSHPVLSRLSDAELARELAESKRLIEAEIGHEVRFFCYPYGCFDKRVSQAASVCYSGGACSTNLRMLAPGDDRFALPRVDVHYLRNFGIFQSMFTGRFRLYLHARRIVRHFISRSSPVGMS